MTAKFTQILTAPPGQAQAALAYGAPVAHMAYRLGSGGRLLRSRIPPAAKGGLMMMDDQGFNPNQPGNPTAFAHEVVRECVNRGWWGVVADWELAPSPFTTQLALRMAEQLNQRNLALYLPEEWGQTVPGARVMISSALSGGSLRARLAEAGEQFGIERICLAVERCGQEFLLPSPRGQGVALTPEQLQQRLDSCHPRTFFSSELCAHYFTWQDSEGRARFVLFDNQSSLRQKLQVAQRLGACGAILAYPEVADLLPGVLI